jgi:hypothetical protein
MSRLGYFPGLKRTWREIGHLIPSNVEVKNEGSSVVIPTCAQEQTSLLICLFARTVNCMQISNCVVCNLKVFHPCHILFVLVTYLSVRGLEIRKVVGYVIVEIINLYELYFGLCVDAL